MCLNSRWKERNHEMLCSYLQQPVPGTVLVLCHMHGNFDSRRQLVKLVREHGVVFESKPPAEHELARFAMSYMKERGVEMDAATAQLMADHVGRDLSRLAGELQKLIVVLKEGEKRITPEHVERNIGISRKYNIFELQNAVVDKDIARCMQIVDYMGRNPKENPIQFSLPILFSFFTNLMQAYYAPDRSDRGIAVFLSAGGRPLQAWQVTPYMKAMRHYSGMKTMHIIHRLRMADARSKGVDATSSYSDAQNLRELIHFILH
jgi:DNA polymerase-3 subunit delta